MPASNLASTDAPPPPDLHPEASADAADALAVANRLRPVLVRIGRQLRRELHALNVTSGQASLLAVIHSSPGIGVGELAAREQTSAPTMCAHIDRLAAAGLVERVRRSNTESDRRRVGLKVTPEGERVLRAVRSRRTAWLARRLRTLSAADLAAIDAALEPLSRLAEVKP